MSVFDTKALRDAFGSFMTGVTVVTAVDHDGQPVGFTANSFSSVSLDPPLLLVCPGKTLNSLPVFTNCSHFAVNVLAEDQRDISNIFASFEGDRFAQIQWYSDNLNCPIVEGASASFSCAARQRMDAGDHIILLGEIKALTYAGTPGLGYSNNGYFSLRLEREAQELPQLDGAIRAGVIIEYAGKVLVDESPQGGRLPAIEVTRRNSTLPALKAYLAETGIEAIFGPVYSVFQNKLTGGHSVFYRAKAANADPCGLGNYVPVEQLSTLNFASHAQFKMIQRYVLERENGLYSLYVGNDQEGEIHSLEEDLH